MHAAGLVYEQVLYKHRIWLKVKNDAVIFPLSISRMKSANNSLESS